MTKEQIDLIEQLIDARIAITLQDIIGATPAWQIANDIDLIKDQLMK
jgi:hypothetical protein